MKQKGIYIPSIDAKDIYLACHYIQENPNGYSLKRKDGDYNLHKFVNCLVKFQKHWAIMQTNMVIILLLIWAFTIATKDLVSKGRVTNNIQSVK